MGNAVCVAVEPEVKALPKAVQDAIAAGKARQAELGLGAESPVEPGTPPVEAPPIVEAPPVVAASATSPPPEPDFKQMYLTLKGKYDAELSGFRDIRDELKEIRNENKRLSDKLVEQPLAPPKTDEFAAKFKEDYGESMYNDISRLVRSIVGDMLAPEVRKVSERLDSEVGAVRQTAMQQATAMYLERLTALMPDWRTLQNDPTFNAWLASNMVPYTRLPLMEQLNNAAAAHDVETVVSIINAFKEANRPVPPAAPAVSLEELLQPPAGPGAQPPPPAAPARTYTESEIAQFNKDVALGKWRGKEAEVMRIRKDLFNAAREGRIHAG